MHRFNLFSEVKVGGTDDKLRPKKVLTLTGGGCDSGRDLV